MSEEDFKVRVIDEYSYENGDGGIINLTRCFSVEEIGIKQKLLHGLW